MNDVWLKAAEEFMAVAQRAWQRGLVAGSGGNISLRLPGTPHIMIKPSGVATIECRPETLLRVDLRGKIISGAGRPSKDLNFHLAIYGLRPEVQGILHAHVPWSTALTLLGYRELPLVTPQSGLKLGRVPVVPYAPSETPELEALVAEAFHDPRVLCALLARHGLVAVGTTLTEACNVAELVEETAQIALLVRLGGGEPSEHP
jgi:L-ribulose-5-phosphate 4-epimerase